MHIPLESIEQVLARIAQLRVGIIGDFALDLYYQVQKNTTEFSLETEKQVYWGAKPVASPGGAGNVAQNVAALGVQQLWVFGCVGPDLYGRELLHCFQQSGITTSSLIQPSEGWDTCTYVKPMLRGQEEDNRLDFGTHNTLSDAAFEGILLQLDAALPSLDVLIVNQQFPNPLLSPKRIERLNALIAQHPSCYVVADLRHFGDTIRKATLKVNTAELAFLLNSPDANPADGEQCATRAKRLSALTGGPILITRGEHGMMYVSEHEPPQQQPALPLRGPLDTVGAGDTSVAAFALARAAGAEVAVALRIANAAAGVTVQKLQQTGTATAAEIHALLRQHSEA